MSDRERHYRFYVKPLNSAANEAIATWFNSAGDSSDSLTHTTVEVEGTPVGGVFEVPSRFVSELKRSDHKDSVRVYVQEGGGKVRPFLPYLTMAKRLARTKPVGKVKQQIKTLAKS